MRARRAREILQLKLIELIRRYRHFDHEAHEVPGFFCLLCVPPPLTAMFFLSHVNGLHRYIRVRRQTAPNRDIQQLFLKRVS